MEPECYERSATVPLNYDANGMPAEGPGRDPYLCMRIALVRPIDFICIEVSLPKEDHDGL